MNWPFKRRVVETDSLLPEEVVKYYHTEKKDRNPLAWLLAAGTLIVTILFALGLFFGGRFIYRQITNNTEVAVQTPGSEPAPANTPNEQPDTGVSQPPATVEQTPPPTQPAPSAPAPTPAPAAPTQTTGDSTDTALPRSGPADTLGIFVSVTIITGTMHRIYFGRRAKIGI